MALTEDQILPGFRHEWGELTLPDRDEQGSRRTKPIPTYRGCLFCRIPKAAFEPSPGAEPRWIKPWRNWVTVWCQSRCHGTGITTVPHPDSKALIPTHPGGDELAEQILTGGIAPELARRAERRRQERLGELRQLRDLR